MKRKLLLLFLLLVAGSVQVWAQIQAGGRVLDETGQPMIGAAVSVRGTSVGTVTDLDGYFKLNVPEGTRTLTIQAVGYNTQEVAVGSAVTVRMVRAARELTGAVVTALGIRREKRELGYSATTLNSDDINSGNQVSVLSSLAGKTAGMNITSATGGPGGSTRVVLRGEKSLGNNNALIVVDGVPINNGGRLLGRNGLSQIDFGNRGNDINPEDIESVTVLKGPQAAALYGSAGANGAIMITTKSGRSANRGNTKGTVVTYSTNYSLQNVLKYPELQHKYGQGNVFDGIPDDRRENFSWGLPFDGILRPWGQEINGMQQVKPYSDIEDNIKDFFRTGTTWENNVSLGGSTDNSSYYLSLNSLNNKGITPSTFYDKYSIRFNGSAQLNAHFSSSININYININQRVEQEGQRFGAVWENVLQTPRDIPLGEARDLDNPFYGYGFVDAQGVSRFGYYNLYALNPFWVAENFDNRNRTDRFLGDAVLTYKKGAFEIFDRVGVDVGADRTTNKIPKFTFSPYDDFYAGINDPTSPGGLFEDNINSSNFYNDLIAQFRKEVSDNFTIDVMGGTNFTYNRATALSADIDPENNGLVIPDYYNFANATGAVQVDNILTRSASTGVYGRVSLGFMKALFFDVTARNDWTSTLVTGNNSYFYPSASVSWIFTESLKNVSFFQNVLTYGKLRASYASVGNGAGPYNNNNAAYVSGGVSTAFGSVVVPFNGEPGYTFENILGNPDLTPERTNSFEIGTEMSFLRDRISTEFTWYHNSSIDQIIPVPLPPSSGYTSRYINTGEIRNNGVELSLRVVPISRPNGLRWELFGTYTKNNNKVLSLAEGVSQITIAGGQTNVAVTATVGQPFGAFYAIDVQRDAAGRVIVDSTTGIPLKTSGLVFMGTFQPRFIASWGTSLKYKGFALNVLFDTKQGGVFYSSTKDLMDFVGTAKETEDRDPQVWENSVYLNSAGNPVLNHTAYDRYEYFTSNIPDGRHIIDASYIKLREASLYYTLNTNWLHHTPFGSASIGVFGNNLAIWTNRDNMYVDPEQTTGGSGNLQGYDFRARPSVRNYGISLRVTF